MSTPHLASGRPDLHVVDVHALEPCTAASAVRQIVEHIGCTRSEAEAMVGRYLDEVSEQVGCSVRQWGLDPHDLAAILTDNGHAVTGADELPDPLDRAAASVADVEHAADQAEITQHTDAGPAQQTDTDTDTAADTVS
ncbi:hypothetical protein [Pseudonocardia humida]|uniref:Uncharacterized protein n=1 Tax=Pseudonocardia humida TaxID=2800819 RepID=A0ABT1A8E9_9PSEU|nr:hypothetical protein [Pseudonocardia humida]MCO1659210.1 hypothetical protein [Pseudonocardia humida]